MAALGEMVPGMVHPGHEHPAVVSCPSCTPLVRTSVCRMPHANPFPAEPTLLVVTRFRVSDRMEFAQQARRALAVLADSQGFVEGAIGQSTDETDLLIVTTRWQNVGAYRKALSRYEVKLDVVPLLSTAVDESSAFELVHLRVGSDVTDTESGRAADADVANLGESAAPYVPPVST